MKLFKYEGYKITVEPEALLLKPFKALWKRDRSLTKEKAMMELGFIYFFCDVRSDYQYIVDPEDRMEQIKLGEGLPKDWKPDSAVKEAIDFYNSFKSSSILLLEDTRKAVNKFREMLDDIDFGALDANGKPVYPMNTVLSTIAKVPELVRALDEAERSIAAEIAQNDKVRGAQTKSVYEDL
jgi:hypothetical protein